MPFYIGKGTVIENCVTHEVIYRRAYSNFARNKIWKRIVNKTTYDVEIIYQTNNKEEINKKEIEFIKLYGRIDTNTGTLSNLTDGGEGQHEVSKESLKRAVEKRRMNGSYEYTAKINSRPVHTYDADGNYIKSYTSKRECSKDLNLDISVIFVGIKDKRMFDNKFYSNVKFEILDISGYSKTRFTRKRSIR